MKTGFITKQDPNTVPYVDVVGYEPDSTQTDIILPEFTHSIEKGAFSGCADITSVTFPRLLTDVGSEAFKDCTSLKEVTMPECSDHCDISFGAFDGCTSLEKVYIPSCNIVSDSAFSNCTALKEIYIGDQADVSRYAVNDTLWYKEYESDFVILGGVLLEYRGSEKNVTVPEGVWMIGNDAFMNCNSIETVTLPQSIRRIDYLAFFRCTALHSVSLPQGLCEIFPCAFVDCESLTSVRIPDSVTFLGEQVFDGCKQLENIILPLSAVSDICLDSTLTGCPALKTLTFTDSGETVDISDEFISACSVLIRYNGKAKDVAVPEGITRISSCAFAECDSVETVTIPEGVTEIGENAFIGCKNLRSVRLPETLLKIGSGAFAKCPVLTSANIPAGIEYLGPYMFFGCTSVEEYPTDKKTDNIADSNSNNDLIAEQVICKYTGSEKEVCIPDGVKVICEGAFKDNKDIVSVRFPKTLAYLGEEAFSGCTALREIHLPPQAPLDCIGQGAFKGCTALENVFLGNIKYIGDESFKGCTSLRTAVVFGECVEVGFMAFENCTSLGSVVLPDGINEICGGAFRYCPRLKDVYLPAGEDPDLILDEVFDGCTALERRIRCRREANSESIPGVIENGTLRHFDDTDTDCLVIPSSVKRIAAGAFKDCKNLRLIVIPDTVEDIDESAFDGCTNLEDVIIPDGSDIVTPYMLEGTKWYSDNKDGFFILGGTLLEYSGTSRDITVPPSVKRITDEALAQLCSSRGASISLPSTMTEKPDIPTDSIYDPIVCEYKVIPDRAV